MIASNESLVRDWESKDIAFAMVVSDPGTNATELKRAELHTVDDLLALAMGPALRRSMAAMLEAASVPSEGLSGALRQNGLLAIHYAVSRVYDKDETTDLSKTMAALDSRLKMAERWAQLFEKYVKSHEARKPQNEADSPA